MVEKGQSAELNHVSSTSGSCVNLLEPHFVHFAGTWRATIISLQSPQYHAGMRCPHHSCREMHQSRMLRIHSKYSVRRFSGTISMSPFSTAAMAGSASGLIFTNHRVDARGSIILPPPSHVPTPGVWFVAFLREPSPFKI